MYARDIILFSFTNPGDWAIWGDTGLFIFIVIIAAIAIGLFSRSMAVSLYGGFLVFVVFSMETNVEPFSTIILPILAIMTIGLAFKLWGQVSGGNT